MTLICNQTLDHRTRRTSALGQCQIWTNISLSGPLPGQLNTRQLTVFSVSATPRPLVPLPWHGRGREFESLQVHQNRMAIDWMRYACASAEIFIRATSAALTREARDRRNGSPVEARESNLAIRFRSGVARCSRNSPSCHTTTSSR